MREIIRKWIDVKGIVPKDGISKESLSFLIARKIHEKGIKVPNKFNKGGLVANVVTTKKINELSNNLTLFYVENYKSDVLKQFK